MKKRNLIALLMVVCMMFSLLPVNAIAVGDEGTIPAEETLLSENGNDSAPAGSTNPAGGKDSIPDTGDKPSAAEEPAKDEESGKDEEPAKDEEPGKDEEPAEDEEGGETNVVPMRVVRPDTDKYLTYVFRVDGAEVSRQIVKKGDTLYQPDSPVKDGYKFTGWFVGASELAFGTVGEISESAQINVDAGFTEVLYVFFADTNGRIVHTKEGVKGDVIKTDDVTYGLENTTHAITGWYLEGSYQTPVDSVTLDKENITVYAKVEPGHWLHFDSDGGTYVAPQFYSADATTAAPNVVTKPGYTFSHWEYNGTKFEFGSPLTENITLKAHWNVNTSTRYTVIHWQENADDDGYSYVENETLYGTTGAQTSARAKTYNGFTVQAITQETIKGNGATIVNIYYTRNVYEVKFYRSTGSGWNPGWSEITNNRISAKYGANIRDRWPGGQWKVSPSGSVYQTNIDVMPLGGTSFYETSQYNGSAKYYLEDLNGNYVLDHPDTGASTTATISKEDRYNITGFTVNESKSGKDGERYNGASFYYDRNSYNVVYISHGQTVNTASYKYQQSIADAGNYKLTTPPVGMEKYIFAGWCADPFGLPEYVFDGKTMPAQNITVYAYWAAPTVSGVAYITMEGTGGKNLTIPYGGTIDESMLPDPQKPAGDGWTFAGWTTKNGDTYTPFHFSTKIYENIELYPYYTNKNSYTVTYTDGKNTVTDMKHYAPGAHADVQANSFAVPEGKVFLGWAETADGNVKYQPNDKLRMNASVTLHAVWGNKDAVVSLTYNANGGQGGTYVKNGYVNNGLVTLWDGSGFSRAGYSLDGWSTDPNAASAEYKTGSTARVDSTGDNILYAVWKANENTAYKVEFYCEQTDGAYTLAKTEPRTGTTDATVSVTDIDKAYGAPTYVYDAANANNVESGPVAADGSLTLKLYFKRNTAEYTIHHYLKGTEVKVAPDQTGTMTIGDTLTASASSALGAEYASAHVDSYSPSQSLEMKATGNIITVYYTVPLTITAESASRAYNAQPLTQPDFKVEGLVNGDQKKDITLSMTKESTITNVGSVPNVIDTTTVRFKGGELPGGYYELPTYQPGTLTITPNTDEVTVTITGNHDTRVYNGSEQSVTGYTTDVGEKTISVTLKEGSKAEAKGTNAGKYDMGLTKDNFTVTSQNYSNIKVVVVDGYLEIDPIADKVTVTVTEKSGSAVYNGQEHSVTGYETMTANNALYDVTTSVHATETAAWTAKGVDVGKYPVGIVSGDFANTSKNFTNVVFTVVDGALTISPISEKTITVTAASGSKKYDGTPLTNNGFSCTEGVLVPGDVLTAVVEGSATNVGDEGKNVVKSYKVMRGGADVTGNYTFTDSVDGKLTILPRTVTLTSETASKEYDGAPLTRPDVSVTGDGFVSGEVTGITATGSVTYVSDGTVENTITYTTGAAFREENYEITKLPGQLSIKQSSNAIVITTASRSREYNGKKLLDNQTTHTGTLAAGDRLVVEFPADAGLTDVGTKRNEYKSYRVERSDGADVTANYTFGEPVIGTLTVTPVAIELTANSAAKAYDGTPLTDSGYTISNGSFVGEEGLAGVTVEGSQTAVGSSANTITGHKLKSNTLAKNYTITYADGTLTVTQSEKVITVTANSHTWEYDGQPHSDGGYTVVYDGETYTVAAGESQELPTGGLTLTATVVGTVKNVADSAKDNNKITVVAITDAAGNVVNDQFKTITRVPGTLTITKRGAGEEKVILKAANNAVVYDGQPHGVCLTADGKVEAGTSYTITYLVDGHSVETVITGSRTAVGKYPGILVPDKNNTRIVDGSGNDVTDNYEITYRNGDLEIVAPGTVVVEIKGIRDSVVYDGSKHEVNGYTVVSISNRAYTKADFSLAEGKSAHAEGTNVGEYYMNLEPESFVNNNTQNFTSVQFVIVEDGLLEITPITDEVTVTITGNTATEVYNGSEQSVTGYTTDVGTKTISVKLNETGKDTAKGTNAGTYPMGLTAEDFTVTSRNYSNIKVVVKDGWLKIDPIADKVTVTVTENSAAVTYDGTEHSVTGYKSMTADNTLYDVEKNVAEKPTKAWTAKGTDVGEYPVGIKAADFKNTSGNFTNVEFVIVDGTLKIDPVSDKVTVTITENADTVIYDTKEHSVTGYKSMTADNALYDVKKNVAETPTEAWTAKGTDVGEYPVGIKAGDFENTSGNFTNVEFVIVDGALKIAPAESIVVKIAGNTKTVTYNGEEQSVEGYTVTSNPANAEVTLVGKAVATGTDADTYPMGLTAADFTATSPNYETVVIKVTDGWLKINPVSDKVTVTVTEKSDSVVYDGQEHSVTGYKSMTADNALYNVKTDVAETPTEAWTAKGTNAGKYQVGIKSGDFKNTSVNFTNVAFVIVDGELEITPVTDKVTVTVVEKSDNVTYDAAEHSITGYETMTADNALYDIANVAETPTAAWTAKGTEAGEYPVGIVSGDFKNTSKNFANVEFVIVDGALTITTDDTEVVVTVTGNTKTVVYDGTEHSVEGYTVDVNGLPITVTPKAGTAAKASGTNAGTYYMGLTADDFTAESNNYSNIRIVVTDGWLKIDPITDKVTVTVTENAGTVEYDGKEHSVTGYASIVSDHALYDVANVAETPTDAWTAKGTDAGTYPVGIKSGDFRNTSGNFTNVEFVIEDGELVITRRGENPGSPVTLRADDNTVMFDGDYHGYVGHIATNLAEGHSVRSVKSDFTARNVGRYEDKIDLHDAIIVDADGKDVTRNYVLTYQPGTLEITPFEGEVVVTVTGNTGLFRYDGKIHTVEGYTLEATVPFFTEDDIRFTGDATISEVRPGDYVMNLKDEEFSAANDNFTSVKFVVIDGSMRIYTVRYTVAWMFDTDQMLTGDSPNRYFTSMANYIDRSDISLVLHSGNVVADAGAQSQWDVFNNAMQPLYDDEEVDVLMIAAEKEAASGSLFLQQPVREDFKEEDLFENGKGFVRRFNIGEKSVILVGLGADAMTEEGYKWAREKFNSDKDASGILLVNNYLLEDMRKPDKIDERALDLEKNVVKACSNVRMVLSSSGGYSSHYEFYYGERKVIAINSDIEAAAKAGYFTQLTFNEDLNILSVTNLCPYTYDFVYNERQAYKECYVLNNVL